MPRPPNPNAPFCKLCGQKTHKDGEKWRCSRCGRRPKTGNPPGRPQSQDASAEALRIRALRLRKNEREKQEMLDNATPSTPFDLSELWKPYGIVIKDMPQTFTAHEFILKYAHQNQITYIEALYAYRNHERSGTPSPFLIVHGLMAKHLAEFPTLIRKGEDTKSTDIFGNSNGCSVWHKINEEAG